MTYSITVNENTKEGKSVIAAIKLLAEKSDSVKIIEEVSDRVLAHSIARGKASGYANTSRVLKKLRLK